jgi:hypothetical protein
MGVLVSDRRDDEEPISIEADAPEADWIEQHQPVIDESDDDAVSIEADVPEADWIEQHQPVIDESDDDSFPREVREDDDAVGIEADVPEADWIEQHEPVIDETDDDFDVDDEPPVAWPPRSPVDTSGDLPDESVPSGASAGARGCNLIGALVHALLRSRRDAPEQIDRRNPPSSG